jgi:hypothetical protein
MGEGTTPAATPTTFFACRQASLFRRGRLSRWLSLIGSRYILRQVVNSLGRERDVRYAIVLDLDGNITMEKGKPFP